jgi:putative membrane protein insertion efficiency factor
MMNLITIYKKLLQGFSKAGEGFLKTVLIFLVSVYRTIGSQHLGGQCRFHPSCSQYSLEALQTLPVLTAIRLITKRILKCHPFGSSGWDPVPSRKERFNDRKQQSAAQIL